MDKQIILDEIRRVAEMDGGTAPGKGRFERETGIRESKWLGVHWVKWSDAVTEAGYRPQSFRSAHPEELILSKLAGLVCEKGRFPTSAEIRLQKRIDPEFPWHNVVSRLGNRATLIRRVSEFCKRHEDYADALALLPRSLEKLDSTSQGSNATRPTDGSVYLVKSGRHYKIDFTNDLGRRNYDLRIQLPERADLVHAITTDDPKGIEQYWHRRFADRRVNGEWFSLTPDDIRAFKRRKSM